MAGFFEDNQGLNLQQEFDLERIARTCAGVCPIGRLFHATYSELLKERKKNARRGKAISTLMAQVKKLETRINRLEGGSK